MRPRTLLIVVLAVIGVGALVTAVSTRSSPTPKPPATVVVELASDDVATVGRGDITRTLAITGTLQAERQTTVTAQVEGQISAVDVRPGQPVRRGDVLARLDGRDLERQAAVAQAQLAKSRDLLEYNRKLAERNQNLLKQNFISKNAFDTTQNQLQTAGADTRSAEAQLGLAQQALAKAVTRAPFDGIVAERFAEPGQHIGVNGKLFTVVDLTSLELVANVPARRIGEIHVDQPVGFEVDGFAAHYSGRITRINPSVDAASKAVQVYIRIDNRDGALRNGLFAQGLIDLASHPAVLTLPLGAVHDDGGKSYVLAIEAGKLVRRPVRTGARDDRAGLVEIAEGLQQGSTVLTGNLQLAPGATVKLPQR
ncbi:hypothetical protein BJP62_00845 [Jeongeupia sp. USM3]|nr:hypothetical protein BJP62_00845 [Jeongeupia sp. USM3]